MRRQHRAGEALEVDYAGMTLSVIDKDVVRQAQVFVACLPCSDLTYAEASCAGAGDGDERCRPLAGAAPASRYRARRVGYGLDRTLPTEEKLGLEGTPRLRATGFFAATVGCALRGSDAVRAGAGQLAAPPGGNARAGRPHNPC